MPHLPHLRQRPLRHRLAWLFAALALLAGPVAASPASAAGPGPASAAETGPVSASVPLQPLGPVSACSADDYDNDARLGPAVLPDRGVVGRELVGYQRFGGMTEAGFLKQYWDSAANGWRYPPADGFLIGRDGKPVKHAYRLRVNLRVDRFGSEYGGFLAPYGTRYAKRSIPPQSLDNAQNPAGCNWRAYRVLRAFEVQSGPIAPAFAQPGHGVQYMLDGALVPGAPSRLNVLWLVDNGYLARLN
ncbi:TNT domain-containing protein [Actinomadura oligospora]|uniref:TNT domain-containing protein n=1 Tax=Actinomadura oligospora TaxID=111804 RepID=UPI0004B3C454|nr:TNT domain-containing protein [Actinomadura oligospora]